jgi:hypothetical protein
MILHHQAMVQSSDRPRCRSDDEFFLSFSHLYWTLRLRSLSDDDHTDGGIWISDHAEYARSITQLIYQA